MSGLPLPQVQWFGVSEEESPTAVMEDSSTALTESRGEYVVISTLTLLSIQESGTFMCSANNSLGMDTALAEITVYCKDLLDVVGCAEIISFTSLQLSPPSWRVLKKLLLSLLAPQQV